MKTGEKDPVQVNSKRQVVVLKNKQKHANMLN